MSRLTEKYNDSYVTKGYFGNTDIMKDTYNAIQKLGKLEDLEEELGCPLEVVISTLKNGLFNNCNEHCVVGLTYILGSYMFTCFDEKGNTTGSYPIKEYGKTWF